ncbi:MAG: DUF3160 domain-containing protein, partial [Candidatus Thorarchaeota archaeon]
MEEERQFSLTKQKRVLSIFVIIIIGLGALSFTGYFFNPLPTTTTTITTTTPVEELNNLPSIFTVREYVPQDFSDFTPYNENASVDFPEYTIATDLSNIANLDDYTLSQEERDGIAASGLVVRPSNRKRIYEIYQAISASNNPSFITSDAVLHTYHVLFDVILRETETRSFYDILRNMTFELVNTTYSQYESAPDGLWKESALRNTMFFGVAARLLDNSSYVPAEALDEVTLVLDLIESHEGLNSSWFLNYDEDFSQYIPRGHYTRSELLEQFFKAMMWYGRISFDLSQSRTAQAILISIALNEEFAVGVTGNDLWNAIYYPTVFFVGESNHLIPLEYSAVITEVYGNVTSINDLDDDVLLDQFIVRISELRKPLIFSRDTEQRMRFMGQRFIPDSYIFSQLIDPRVETRYFPRGLDVVAAFGSNRAWSHLDDEKGYTNYTIQMELLWDEISNMSNSEWTKNLYYQWLYSLLPLIAEPGEGFPLFMQNDAWLDKQLITALGSWAELRHDTILYATPTTVVPGLTTTPTSPHPVGFVEPVPRLYSRLNALCTMMIDGLQSRSLLTQYGKLSKLSGILNTLEDISKKELLGQPVNQSEIDFMLDFGDTLEELLTFTPSETW